MNAVKAIFMKQLSDFPKNIAVTLMYILFPAMAFLMGNFMGEYGAGQVAMFAAMFAGSTPMIAIANTVAEDNEYKGLRFLVMAGVKPWQYLLGLSGFVLIMSAISLALFVLMGDFGELLTRFLIVAALACISSAILGGAVGIFAKNVQQANAIYTPLMLALFFLPMLAGFNETVERIAQFLFSYQVLVVALDPDADFTRALIVIGANLVVLLAFFVIAFKKKGLKG